MTAGRERLREALERIAGDLDDAEYPATKADRMRNIARAALAHDTSASYGRRSDPETPWDADDDGDHSAFTHGDDAP